MGSHRHLGRHGAQHRSYPFPQEENGKGQSGSVRGAEAGISTYQRLHIIVLNLEIEVGQGPTLLNGRPVPRSSSVLFYSVSSEVHYIRSDRELTQIPPRLE
jgi:hypothetical protein